MYIQTCISRNYLPQNTNRNRYIRTYQKYIITHIHKHTYENKIFIYTLHIHIYTNLHLYIFPSIRLNIYTNSHLYINIHITNVKMHLRKYV